jgi:AraC family transcriptional regulator, regulatory protein of adaptative response / DNA-3-methyladenine glycosylase II
MKASATPTVLPDCVSEDRLAAAANVELTGDICLQAIRSRDERFDGLFYVAAVTTGVYCRPTCPVPFAKPQHIVFFPSAVAAEIAGFRACRRCHSGARPGSPAWLGTSAVVSRALRLICEGALCDGGVQGLAERVGIGARQLRRLFIEHLGMPPVKVGGLYRLYCAQILIQRTEMPMAEIALAAGFNSVRQFNHAARSVWAQRPSQLRDYRALPTNASRRKQHRVANAYPHAFDRTELLKALVQWGLKSSRAIGSLRSPS